QDAAPLSPGRSCTTGGGRNLPFIITTHPVRPGSARQTSPCQTAGPRSLAREAELGTGHLDEAVGVALARDVAEVVNRHAPSLLGQGVGAEERIESLLEAREAAPIGREDVGGAGHRVASGEVLGAEARGA